MSSVAPTSWAHALLVYAGKLAPERLDEERAKWRKAANEAGLDVGPTMATAMATVAIAYPALARTYEVALAPLASLLAEQARPLAEIDLRDEVFKAAADLDDIDDVRRALRLYARSAKTRFAIAELVGGLGFDVDDTARGISDLASACIDVAVAEARRWATRRYGEPRSDDGSLCRFAVIGMGKLGGSELNPGSDVDLVVIYESDVGAATSGEEETELREYFARVTQRFVATLEEPTDDGVVWRVDLRLRPEGARGPIAQSFPATERYYEAWGRTWERAALVRARAIAGDIEFGEQCLGALEPFVWRRRVEPKIADEMSQLVARARVELDVDDARDVKLGRGGIREAEFFVQSLQLIWGGREPALREANTHAALARLRALGYVTDHEAVEIGDAYLFLRRIEHRIQFGTQLHTHALPADERALRDIAWSLGYADVDAFTREITEVRAHVHDRLESLTSGPKRLAGERVDDIERILIRVTSGDEAALARDVARRFGITEPEAFAKALLSLARRPDDPLGEFARDAYPELGAALVEALGESPDSIQAAVRMGEFFSRFATPTVYVRAFAADRRALRRIANLFGASTLLGEVAVRHPGLLDSVLFTIGVPTATYAGNVVADELAHLPESDRDDPDSFVGALRRAQGRVTMDVGVADLAGEISTRECTLVLSGLADATLARALEFSMRERGIDAPDGLVVVAMGKLGGREIGYGSDLDIFFVYDDAVLDAEIAIRVAQRVLLLVSMPHGDGTGYELDTRLRPSGNQGLLVVSREGFRAYQHEYAQDWERQALIKARWVAGSPELGRHVESIAREAAYEREAPDPRRLHRLRQRMEFELGSESRAYGRRRFDIKLGRGGLVDVEFAVQWLQMRHGANERIRTQDTESAIAALEQEGIIDAATAEVFGEGYRFLRLLEQRVRVDGGMIRPILDERADSLEKLARRAGFRATPAAHAADALLERYEHTTSAIRSAYLELLGVGEDDSPSE